MFEISIFSDKPNKLETICLPGTLPNEVKHISKSFQDQSFYCKQMNKTVLSLSRYISMQD